MEDILNKCEKMYSPEDVESVRRAIDFATECHKGQTRASGEPYIVHPLAVADILLDINADPATVIAAILHDTVEDCDVTSADITERFGSTVALLVDGVTKLSKTSMLSCSNEERRAENFRKMFLAIARDFRVIVIKLADRLNNMRTLNYCTREKQIRIADETLRVYAPLAHRFGIGAIKCELEDLSLKYLHPEVYEYLKTAIEPLQMERMALLKSAMERISTTLADHDIKASISGRPKHLYSIYRKMKAQHIETIDEIYDLIALRIIVETESECYVVFGLVQAMWTHAPGRLKDYITVPKPNMYRSIHTTLFDEHGLPFEVQIRTYEMHQVAEYGIASHWQYKEGRAESTQLDRKLSWFREALEFEDIADSAREFFESIETDFFSDYVFVMTPRGEIIDLPIGSTPLDFAYRIHTDIGHRTQRAKVNGSIVKLDYVLQTNDVVEIITGPTASPNRNWLSMVHTQQAKAKIKHWFKQFDRDENIAHGKEILNDALRRFNMSISDFSEATINELFRVYGLTSFDDLYAAIGNGTIAVTQILNKLTDMARIENADALLQEKIDSELEKSEQSHVPTTLPVNETGVIVKGFPTIAVHFAGCCRPLPGDDIIGYVTKGHGVSIHRADCHNAASLKNEPERLVEVQWVSSQVSAYVVHITIVATERTGLLLDVSRALLSMHIDIRYMNADTDAERKRASVRIAFEIEDKYRLQSIINSLREIESVIDVYRVNG